MQSPPSTKALAKEAQQYREKPIHRTCATCQHFASDSIVTRGWEGAEIIQQINKRCTLGKFSVRATSTCNQHNYK